MLLKVATTVLLLALFIQHAKGFQKVLVITEIPAQDDNEDDMIATRAVGNNSASNMSTNRKLCCMHGKCSCSDFINALVSLTSNTVINITADVTLSSVIPIVGVANITITGYNNPTIRCYYSGGLHFISCNNLAIEGITWEGCGDKSISDNGNVHPVLHLYNSSNITIKNCTFQHSIGQAMVLSGVSGYVNINQCNFISNKFEGHGTAIYYSSNMSLSSFQLSFLIARCNFSHNERAQSVLYFGPSSYNSCEYLHLQNSNFYLNMAVPIYITNQNLYINGNIEFYGNLAENGGGIYISNYSNIYFCNKAVINFLNNRAHNNGGAIFLTNRSSISFKEKCTDHQYCINCLPDTLAKGDKNFKSSFIKVIFYYNSATHLGQDIYAYNSSITVGNNAIVALSNIYGPFLNSSAVFTEHYSSVTFEGKSVVMFTDYRVHYQNGGAVHINDHSTLRFKGRSTVRFKNIRLYKGNGGVMYINKYSSVTFEGNSNIMFYNNFGVYSDGGAVYIDNNSTFTVDENSSIIFNGNIGSFSSGGALYIDNNSSVTFKGNTSLMCSLNAGNINGGTMYIDDNSTITFEGNSKSTFTDNGTAGKGGVMYVDHYSAVLSKDNATVAFYNNTAESGGALYITTNSTVIFEGNSTAAFHNNRALNNGGSMYTYHSAVILKEKSTITFDFNYAFNTGALFVYSSTFTFKEDSAVKFISNRAYIGNGGAIYVLYSNVIFEGNSNLLFYNNKASTNGGAVYVYGTSSVKSEGNSTVLFYSNNAYGNGGGMCIYGTSTTIFKGNSMVMFSNNTASANGGALYIYGHSDIKLEENSTVTFNDNMAISNGAALYVYETSVIIFGGTSMISFHSNTANGNGGAMCIIKNCTINFKGSSKVKFYNNTADINGGAMHIVHKSIAKFEENTNLRFANNKANLGGSTYIKSSQILIQGNVSVIFTNNTALKDGGAMYLNEHSNFTYHSNSNVDFYYNTAKDYGGAVYVLLKNSSVNINSSDNNFKNNTAGTIQKALYINVPKSCDHNCVYSNVNIVNNTNFSLATSPSKLILHKPAQCINENDKNCNSFYMDNIMLGQEIMFDACVLDYYNQPTEAAQFLVTGMNHEDYNISGPNYITISCNHMTQGISITGSLHSNNSYNYSMTISLYVVRASESKTISVNLILGLSHCHPGFQYLSKSKKCECYDTKNIISCPSSNTSTIKRGYWFGSIDGKPTVTFCPNDYCNFTCCEITNGVYHLYPVRANQCRPHRSGIACGNCEKGFTLSFDSPECIEINQCTVGQMVLVISLSLLYWIAVIVMVFIIMHTKVTIGSLYAIIYYYSVVDILLRQALFNSNGLYTTVSIMSSLAKLTPQFLGQFCLVRNMSGIDQQFIHYLHPLAVSLILVIISMLARRSHRFSSFISRAIIQFICFLLLLSYTSVATTSLLLMRSLTFVDVDKVYTYLSPDIEYLHGRHLAYVIVAVIFTIVIVIGLPLLLLSEPLLNSKINFVRIKPLLDQFQCCYKDKYRCFAAYYMICRIVIIVLVIAKISDEFTTKYLLISACALMGLIHLLLRPYISMIDNIFDGIILQSIVILSVLPIVEYVNNYNETFVEVIAYLLLIWPLVGFITIKLWINRNKIQNAFKYCKTTICSFTTPPTNDGDQSIEVNEVTIVVDDNMRRNTTVVDV